MATTQTVTAEALVATLSGLTLPIGLRLASVEVAAQGIKVTEDPFRMDLPTPGRLKVRVTELDLSNFLSHQAPGGMKDFKVTARQGDLLIEATAMMILPIQARVTCTLSIRDSKRLFVDLQSVDVMGIGAKGMVQSQIDQINPVFDMDDFPVEGTLESVQIVPGEVLLTGAVTPKF